MTPQEQYPKFFDHPHYWIDAIEVEREHTDIKERLTLDFLTETIKNDDLHKYKPLFKPQEGEQFIKDIEEAVSAGCFYEPVKIANESKWDIYFELVRNEGEITVTKDGLDVQLSHNVTFNTAAYVDKLRELGYYI